MCNLFANIKFYCCEKKTDCSLFNNAPVCCTMMYTIITSIVVVIGLFIILNIVTLPFGLFNSAISNETSCDTKSFDYPTCLGVSNAIFFILVATIILFIVIDWPAIWLSIFLIKRSQLNQEHQRIIFIF